MDRRHFILTGASIAALSACSTLPRGGALSRAEANALRISKVEIDVAGAAFENDGATTFRNLLADDLKTSMRDEFADRVQAGGAILRVKVVRLNVSSATATAFGRDQSRLQGTVDVVNAAGVTIATFPVDVVAGTEAETNVGGAVQSVVQGRNRYYRLLLKQFSRDTRTLILGRDLPGQRIVRNVTTG